MRKAISLPCGHIERGTAPETRLRWIALLGCMLFAAPLLASETQSFKWLTPSGETVFRPTPPEDPKQPYCRRVNDSPWTCFGGADNLEAPPPDPNVKSAEERQRQQDQLLRSRYRSLSDIDLQMQDELAQVDFQRNVALRNESMQKAQLYRAIRAAADRQRAGLSVQEKQLTDVAQARAALRDTVESIALIDDQARQVRERFEERKTRYRQLMERYASP